MLHTAFLAAIFGGGSVRFFRPPCRSMLSPITWPASLQGFVGYAARQNIICLSAAAGCGKARRLASFATLRHLVE